MMAIRPVHDQSEANLVLSTSIWSVLVAFMLFLLAAGEPNQALEHNRH